jgi:hypothetical protein
MPQELGQSLRQSQTVGQWNQSLSLASAEMRALQERLQKSVIRHVKYFQAEFKLKNLEYHLLDVPRPKDAYLMFHISHSDKSKERGICIVEIGDKRVLKIGRT